MKNLIGAVYVFGAAVCCAVSTGAIAAELSGNPIATKASQLDYKNMPDLPKCLTVGVAAGDPMTGPSTVVLKFAAGCDSTMHWHTPNEQLVMIKGMGKLEMKGEAPKPATVGAYNFQPSKHPHRFMCGSGGECLLYLSSDGKFDIHYVDRAGNEIPLTQAEKMAKNM